MFAAALPTSEYSHLLCELPASARDRLRPFLRPVGLGLGEVVLHAGERIRYVYFLTSAIVSLLYTAENGATVEMGVVGNDGMVGAAVLFGGDSTCSRAVVAVAGDAIRIPADVLLQEFERYLTVQHVLLRYMQALITQISQTAVCNRLHSMEQRLCRWLLLCDDRSCHRELLMTQELIAHMLGGRRESVTVAAGNLQDLGLIQYSRGHITILDRPGLEFNACECYRVVADEIARLYHREPARRITESYPAIREAG